MKDFAGNVPGTTAKEILDLLMLTNCTLCMGLGPNYPPPFSLSLYSRHNTAQIRDMADFDTLSAVGNNPACTSVFIPHKVGATEIADAVRGACLGVDGCTIGKALG